MCNDDTLWPISKWIVNRRRWEFVEWYRGSQEDAYKRAAILQDLSSTTAHYRIWDEDYRGDHIAETAKFEILKQKAGS